MEFFQEKASPILDELPSEGMHSLTRRALRNAEKSAFGLRLLDKLNFQGERFYNDKLITYIDDIVFDNPVIVGAGWDKNADCVRALHHLGFGGVEIGSVLESYQYGNPKPRQWMVGSGVALNRLGFPSLGLESVDKNLKRYRSELIPIGVNIGLNKGVEPDAAPDHYASVANILLPHASWMTINVSSPNTPGLRQLQDRDKLTNILDAVISEMNKCGGQIPLFVKVAPDLTLEALDDVIALAIEKGLTGLAIANTTIRPDIKARYGAEWEHELGGLSGNDSIYRQLTTDLISHTYQLAGDKLKIMGLGGVNSWQTALEKIMAGATVIQCVTALREVGPSLAGRINRGLVDYMTNEGIQNISELVGINARHMNI